jgi:hypothetical protein
MAWRRLGCCRRAAARGGRRWVREVADDAGRPIWHTGRRGAHRSRLPAAAHGLAASSMAVATLASSGSGDSTVHSRSLGRWRRWMMASAADGSRRRLAIGRRRGAEARVRLLRAPLAADGLPGLYSTWGDATHKVGSSPALEAGSHRLQRWHEEQSDRRKRRWRVRTTPVETGFILSWLVRDRRAPP